MATITSRAAEPARPAPSARADGPRWRPAPRHAALAAILALSGALNLVRLSQNGYANIFYSAAVKSMLQSWHDFFFVSADPNGLITIDKPPLGVWLQAAVAKVFGFSAMSLLVPEAVCGILAVALLYRLMAPRFGAVAALVGAFALATFPSFVAVSRDNGVDPLLILLMLAACGAAIAATERGRLRMLLLSALLVGLAFNTKSLAALLCVPGIGLAYLACAPLSLARRVAHLLLAGVAMVAVSASWIAAVQLTPASQRPFVGSTSQNSEIQLTFGYNGFGRVGGQQGGPGSETVNVYSVAQTRPLVRPGVQPGVPVPPALARELRQASRHQAPPRVPAARVHRRVQPAAATATRRRAVGPTPFGGSPSPWRIFGRGLGGQAGWLVPLALAGLLALGLALRRGADGRRVAVIVLGGWFLVELAVLDFSSGIVHPYYASALGPGLAAMVGAGAVALGRLVRSRSQRAALTGYLIAVLGVAGTLAAQLVLIDHEGDPLWWRLPLVAVAALALLAIPLLRRRSGWALGAAVAALAVAPMVFSFSVWLAPVAGTFPAAGPYSYAGQGGYGVSRLGLAVDRSLIRFLDTHGVTRPYALLTESADQADALILLGLRASATGGYNTTDPAMSNDRLAGLVAAHRARYVMIAGPYARRGGNRATTAARLVCPEVPGIVWADGTFGGGSYLLDCAGRASALRHPLRYARAFKRRYHVRYRLSPL